MANRDDIIDRIKKLMSYSTQEGVAHEEEIANAMGLARKLMDKYNVEESEVLVHDEAARQSAYEQIAEMDALRCEKSSINRIEKYLAWACDYVCDVKHYINWRTGWDGKRQYRGEAIVFYGLQRDCAVAVALYKELRVTMRALARASFPDAPRQMDFFKGFVFRVVERARLAKKASDEAAQTGAIILAKDALLARYAAEKLNLGKTRNARQINVSDPAAYAAGSKIGDKVSLDTNQVKAAAQQPRKQLGL